MSSVPSNAKVLVIGGGPGGSYAASALAREGVDVLVLESDKFPRYHIGESQLASLRHFLRFIDLEAEFEAYGFQKKAGAGFKLNKHKREGFTDFITPNPQNYSWNVIRSVSDEMMLRHAERNGAKVVEETKVTELEWVGEGEAARPVAALWKNKAGEIGKVAFDFVIDASGRAGIVSTKYLKNRDFNPFLKNIAIWGYWKGAGRYLPGTPRENSPLFEALADESGWNWFIPLHDGTVSVGVVANQELSNVKKAKLRESGGDASLHAYYLSELQQTPNLLKMLEGAEMIKKPDAFLVNSASDYSYQAKKYAGPGYRIIGDAGAFIDPYFSSGVHLALAGALNAAASICSEIRGEVGHEDAARWHSARTDSAYQRFLLVVLSAYQQIRHQAADHLSQQNEDNFDRAFDFFRPIIQGHSDTGNKLAGDDLQKTVEFLGKHAFEPAQPGEVHKLVAQQGDPLKTLPVAKPGDTDEEIRQKNVLKGVAIRKLIGTDDVYHLETFVADTTQGFSLRLERGKLGLLKA